MANLSIRTYPDTILKKKSIAVLEIGKAEQRLAYDMIETMRSANGVGLAAPQVGLNKRIIVVEDIENNRQALVLINPKIISSKGRSSFCEGCLSIPDVEADIIRPEFIVVEAINLDGDKIKIDTGGLLARVIQHEVDHLDGVVFIDRVSFFKRKKIMQKIAGKVCMKL